MSKALLPSTYQPTRDSLPRPNWQKVAIIVHNPTIPPANFQKLKQAMKWNDPYELALGYMNDLRETSYGYANYKVVESIEVDAFPVKEDGFSYTGESYYGSWKSKSGFHSPDWVDYHAILRDYNLVEKVNRGFVDEIWLFAFPFAGYYESRMAGPGAFWCNSPALNVPKAERRFVIMGFSYERGIGEMLENFGHRTESILRHVYRNKKGDENLWERFIRHDKTHPEQAECGWMHYAPNSDRDYDWGNKRVVKSRADDWLNYPNLTGEEREMDCSDWGQGDIRLHHKWWFYRLPHVKGETDGISNNWWEYSVDANRVE
ncbi:MAG TPA: hypothetical protein PK299_06180 [Anaerolineales bacterium]|nr:hypothetical protein [Anaerolineales bacterium]